jgi:hypothetical protein
MRACAAYPIGAVLIGHDHEDIGSPAALRLNLPQPTGKLAELRLCAALFFLLGALQKSHFGDHTRQPRADSLEGRSSRNDRSAFSMIVFSQYSSLSVFQTLGTLFIGLPGEKPLRKRLCHETAKAAAIQNKGHDRPREDSGVVRTNLMMGEQDCAKNIRICATLLRLAIFYSRTLPHR